MVLHLSDFNNMKRNQPVAAPKDLLHGIIKRAKSAGFVFRNTLDQYDTFTITSFNSETGRMVIVFRNEEELKVVYESIYQLFFDITFATAIFGPDWDHHLVALAGAEDKLKYIADNLLIPYDHAEDEQDVASQPA